MEFFSASIEINAPSPACFQWFKTLEVFTRIGVCVDKVVPTGQPNGWAWILRSPAGESLVIDTEIDTLIPNQLVSWHSLPQAPLQIVGRVTFDALAAERTLVTIAYDFIPPAGEAGRVFHAIYGDDAGWVVRTEVQKLKELLESGQTLPAYGLS